MKFEYLLPLRETALGLLFKGFLHNLRGPTQALLMQIELLESKIKLMDIDVETRQLFQDALERMKRQVFRMVDILSSAETEIKNESDGPWDLKELVEKELTFWETELTFKHKIAKHLEIEPSFAIRMPLYRLRAGLCALFFPLVFELARRGGEIWIRGGMGEKPFLEIEVSSEIIDSQNPYFQSAAQVLSPEAELQIKPSKLVLLFKSHAQ